MFEVQELDVEIRQSSFRNHHGQGIKSMSSLIAAHIYITCLECRILVSVLLSLVNHNKDHLYIETTYIYMQKGTVAQTYKSERGWKIKISNNLVFNDYVRNLE